MFKITLRVSDVSEHVGVEAAQDIEREFLERRTWHEQVRCSYADGSITLTAFNDYDRDGLALSDEFSDCLSAYIPIAGIGDNSVFEIVAVIKV